MTMQKSLGELTIIRWRDYKSICSKAKKNMAHVSEFKLPALLRALDNYPTIDTRIGLKLLSMLFFSSK